MIINIISLYLFCAVLMTAFLATYVLSKTRAIYLKFFSALSFCVSIYLLGYLLEINSSSLQQMIFWNQVQYFGLPFFPPFWLLVVTVYSNIIETIRVRYILLLFSIPILTFILRLTNSFHHLYYSTLGLQDTFGFPLLFLGKGPWYYVHNIYLVVCLILTSIILYQQCRKHTDSNHCTHFRILLVSSFIPYIGVIMIIFKLGILGIDYTALIIPISLILTMLTFLKYDFLEVKTLARETIFEKSSIGMLIIDRSYRVIDYNRAAEHFFLFFDIQLQNFSIESSDNKELIELFKSEKMQEYKLNDGDKERFFEIDSIVIMDTYGRNGGTLKYIRDVTEKKKIMEELNTLATIDEMSKLNNRRHFLQLAQQEVERVKRYNQVFSFLMMDIDDFKSINDTYGHAAGDVVIHEMGRLINENFRKTDICGRLGGEEFTVILTNTSIEKALAVAEQFRHLVEQTKVFYGDARINFTISIGVTFYCDKMQNLEELLKYVDEALYEAKDKGRNCIVCKSICER